MSEFFRIGACVAVAAVSALQPVSRRNGLKRLASGGAALAPLLYPAAAEAAFGKPKALTKKQLSVARTARLITL